MIVCFLLLTEFWGPNKIKTSKKEPEMALAKQQCVKFITKIIADFRTVYVFLVLSLLAVKKH